MVKAIFTTIIVSFMRYLLLILLSLFLPALVQAAQPDAGKPLLTPRLQAKAEAYLNKPSLDSQLPAALAKHEMAPVLEKLARWKAIQGERFGSADFAQISGQARTVIDYPRASTTQRKVEGEMEFDTAPELILAWFADMPARTGRGKMLHAHALIESGQDSDAATALLQTGWRTGWMSFGDEDKFLLAYSSRLRPEDHIARARYLMAYGGYSSSRRMVHRLPKEAAQLLSARLKVRGFEAGVDAALAALPADLKQDADLTLDRAYWRRKKNMEAGSLALLTPELDGMAVVRPEQLWLERHFWARRLIKRKRYDEAYALVRHHGLRATKADGSLERSAVRVAYADAEWLAGWIALRHFDTPADAFLHFQRLFNNVSTPVSQTRGAYWLARAAAAMGDNLLTRQWYSRAAEMPHRYYGRLAQENMDIAPQPTVLTVTSLAPENQDEAYRQFLTRPMVTAVRVLKEAKANVALGQFISHMAWQAKTPEEYYYVSRLGAETGRPDLPLKLAKRFERDGIVYQDAGFPTIQLPRNLRSRAGLMHAIARQESVFDPVVVSRAGARGLMQLMPATAKRMANDLGVTYSFSKLTADPAYNMKLASGYLDFLDARFNGAPALMSAAYNAGENAVDRWIGDYGDPRTADVNAIDWMETIPYAETRNYVQRVMEAYIIYARKFTPTARTTLHSSLRGTLPPGG